MYSLGLRGRSMNTDSLPTDLVIAPHFCWLNWFILLCALTVRGVSSSLLKRHNKKALLVAAHTLNSKQKHEQGDLFLPFPVLSPLCSAAWDSVFHSKVWNSGTLDRRWNLFCHQVHDNGILSFHIMFPHHLASLQKVIKVCLKVIYAFFLATVPEKSITWHPCTRYGCAKNHQIYRDTHWLWV